MKLRTMLLQESELAVPASPYLDAYADMRPTQGFTFQALGGATAQAAQDLFPAFTLAEKDVSSRSAIAAEKVVQHPAKILSLVHRSEISGAAKLSAQTSPSTIIAAAKARLALKPAAAATAQAKAPARTQSLSAGRRTIHLGEKFRRGSPAAQDGTAALSVRNPREAEREAAVQRLTLKHASLQVPAAYQSPAPPPPPQPLPSASPISIVRRAVALGFRQACPWQSSGRPLRSKPTSIRAMRSPLPPGHQGRGQGPVGRPVRRGQVMHGRTAARRPQIGRAGWDGLWVCRAVHCEM